MEAFSKRQTGNVQGAEVIMKFSTITEPKLLPVPKSNVYIIPLLNLIETLNLRRNPNPRTTMSEFKKVDLHRYRYEVTRNLYFSYNSYEDETALVFDGNEPNWFILEGDYRSDIEAFLTDDRTLDEICIYWIEKKESGKISHWSNNFNQLTTK